MTLHIVNKSTYSSDALTTCLRIARSGDTVLLIEDGVYAALLSSKPSAQIIAAPHLVQFYALSPDLKTRGLINQLNPAITPIDYEGFVELTEQHEPIQSWF